MITFEQMKGSLLTIDQVHDVLSVSEPVGMMLVPYGSGTRFRMQDSWNAAIEERAGDAPVECYLSIGPQGAATEYQLTKDAILEFGSLCGIMRPYNMRTPAKLIEPHLNYWFREGLTNKYQLLVCGERLGVAVTKSTIWPFSNLRLLDAVLEAVARRFGSIAVYADPNIAHSFQRTFLRLVIPQRGRLIERSGTDNDIWSIGLRLRNSLCGSVRTSIDGYLYRWVCTNGAIDTTASSGVWSRLSDGQSDLVYTWAREASDEALNGLEHSLDAVQSLVDVPLRGEVVPTLKDIFKEFDVPRQRWKRVLELVAESDTLTMYTIMNAITQSANDSEVSAAQQETLLQVGAELAHTHGARCEGCRRLLPQARGGEQTHVGAELSA